jgi:hypothetical protein
VSVCTTDAGCTLVTAETQTPFPQKSKSTQGWCHTHTLVGRTDTPVCDECCFPAASLCLSPSPPPFICMHRYRQERSRFALSLMCRVHPRRDQISDAIWCGACSDLCELIKALVVLNNLSLDSQPGVAERVWRHICERAASQSADQLH